MKLVTIPQKAFTLLEVIIVIIIVGILASLALPRFFKMIEFSRAAEALTGFQAIRGGMERCYLMRSGNYNGCGVSIIGGTALDVDNPMNSPNAHFAYQTTTYVAEPYHFEIVAYRNTLDGGDGTSQIWFTSNGPDVYYKGYGFYDGFKSANAP